MSGLRLGGAGARCGRVPLHMVDALVRRHSFGAVLVCRAASVLGAVLACGEALVHTEMLLPSAAQACGITPTLLLGAVSVPSAASIPGPAPVPIQGLVLGATAGTALVCRKASDPGASPVPGPWHVTGPE